MVNLVTLHPDTQRPCWQVLPQSCQQKIGQEANVSTVCQACAAAVIFLMKLYHHCDLMTTLHSLASSPDNCSLELTPSPMRMWQKPTSCKIKNPLLYWQEWPPILAIACVRIVSIYVSLAGFQPAEYLAGGIHSEAERYPTAYRAVFGCGPVQLCWAFPWKATLSKGQAI